MNTATILKLIRRDGPMSLNDASWTHAPDMLARLRAMVASGELVEGVDRHGEPGYACLPIEIAPEPAIHFPRWDESVSFPDLLNPHSA